MKPLLHYPSSSIIISFFSFTILMIFIINIPTCMCNDYTDCNEAFECGSSSITNLKYPFWGNNREERCGSVSDPNMELTCEESVPKITINDVKYRILEWDNTTQKLTVARDDYWGGICTVSVSVSDKPNNSTFESADQFQPYGSVSSQLNLLYNCDTTVLNVVYSANCGGNIEVVYTLSDPRSLSLTCNLSVIIAIPISVTRITNLDDINEIAQRCVDSGGACGNNGTEFRCFCNDGAYTDICGSRKAPTSSSKRNWGPVIIGASIAGFGVTVFIIIMISRRLKRGTGRQQMIILRQQQQSSLIPQTILRERTELVDNNVEVFMRSHNLSMPRRYSYAEVKMITNYFREKLGQGGYGVVYKASLYNSRQVAVKVISETKGNGEEFINEVASISRTSHMNIVSLLGYCYEENKRALIYEFMPKGSLDKFIYKSEFPNAICDFDWNTLFRIAIGIAKGLEYLHQGCSSRILHLDIKPQNILLDEDFCPKISDFGLAKICQRKDSIVSILGARGTIGYMAPEIFSRAFGGVSYRSDVYSYGMLILEMIGGRKNYDTGGSCTSEMYFPDWIYKDLEQGNTLLNCSTISEEENDMIRKITLVSLWCIQTKPSDRPPMNKVIEMLQGPLSSVSYPPKPVLYSPERPELQVSDMSSSDLYETNSVTVSK
ncbi:receptor-like kinase [Medicago truncatula]|uniref:Receptor-like kinase n=1 Tax=Medicago truncatula TaxID=3880 RepID=G7KV58_MEDTR|nr:receptor-like kinase [Medicago truncatula]